jgi:uncharacterized membrane protein YkvA (DUF1232 family)
MVCEGAGSLRRWLRALAIDLIPDFVPFLGYFDDVVIVPLGIIAVVKLIPPTIMAGASRRCRACCREAVSRTAAAVIVLSGWRLSRL